MGQLKSGIEFLQKSCVEFGPSIEALTSTKKNSSEHVLGLGKRVDEGYNVLKMTLMEKFKKEKTTLEASADKTLQQVADGEVATILKAIVADKADLKAIIAKLNGEQKTAANAVLATVAACKTACDKLTALANKKKDKWLKSAKYKAKIGGYLTALGDISTDLQKMSGLISKASTIGLNAAWVDKCFVLSAGMKVSEACNRTTAEFDGLLKQYEANMTTYVAGLRDEYKHMGNQLAAIGKWVTEADAMEKEADSTK